PVAIINLMNDPAVRRHLPLAQGEFGDVECARFVANKERMWEENGFGPWAFVLDDEFIGWGGLQLEGDDVDVGLVLSQKYWGAGPTLYRRILTHAFEELCVDSVTALLPPSRTRVSALRRLGFCEDGEVVLQDQHFIRYRLIRSR
ncbi:MAG: GNAT family N-acetyltransferase, partial [Okeania sp. SIO2D1]|nr:GNAT family N-acetyltransferase [Okeania sp. SIO2D1]